MTLLTLDTLILCILYVNTTIKYACLHKQSTRLLVYPPKGNSEPLTIQACLRHQCILAPREKWMWFAEFATAIFCLECDGCANYTESSWKIGQDDRPPDHPTVAVLTVSPAPDIVAYDYIN